MTYNKEKKSINKKDPEMIQMIELVDKIIKIAIKIYSIC